MSDSEDDDNAADVQAQVATLLGPMNQKLKKAQKRADKLEAAIEELKKVGEDVVPAIRKELSAQVSDTAVRLERAQAEAREPGRSAPGLRPPPLPRAQGPPGARQAAGGHREGDRRGRHGRCPGCLDPHEVRGRVWWPRETQATGTAKPITASKGLVVVTKGEKVVLQNAPKEFCSISK